MNDRASRVNTATLTNGLRIIHIPSESDVVYCGYAINAGTRNEQIGMEGMAHFCEHLSFKGTARRRAWDIINSLESVGGDLNAFTCKEDTVYYAAIHASHLPKAIDLLSDIVFDSVFPQAEIDKEVEVICDEIECYKDTPSELIYDDFENMLFSGHPLGHNILGNADTLRTFTTADALAFTSRFYYPANAVFFAYGNIDFKRMVKLIEKGTAAYYHGDTTQGIGDNNYGKSNTDDGGSADGNCDDNGYCGLRDIQEPLHRIIKKDTHQCHVMIGNRAYAYNHPRRLTLYLLNNILGGPGMSSRLNMSLREHRGLVYSVDSTMTSYGDTGLWATYFGCDSHDVEKCKRIVLRELDRMAAVALSPAKLKRAKQQIKGQIAIACDNRESYALDMAKSYLHLGIEKDVDALIRRIEEITANDIMEVAQEIFDPSKLHILEYR